MSVDFDTIPDDSICLCRIQKERGTKLQIGYFIELHKAWNKPEKAKEWRAKLLETETWEQ